MGPYRIAHNNHIVEINVPNEIVARRYTFDKSRSAFIFSGSVSLSFKQKVEILHVNDVEEFLTGQKIVCILIVLGRNQTSIDYTCYIISPCFQESRFKFLKKFTQRCVGQQELHTSYLTDGPSVVIVTDSKILKLFRNTAGSTLQEYSYSIKDSPCKNCGKTLDVHILNSQLMCTHYQRNRCLLFLVVSNNCLCSDHNSEVVVIQHHEEVFSKLESSMFIPQEYSSSLTTLCVQKLVFDENNLICSNIFIGTSQGFVVGLENGFICSCEQLDKAQRVTSLALYKAPIVVCERHIICRADQSIFLLSGSLQAKKCVPGVNQVLCGDFLNTGGQQLLLLYGDSLPQTPLLVSECDQVQLLSSEGLPAKSTSTTSDSVTASLLTVSKALTLKLQKRQLDLASRTKQGHERKGFLKQLIGKHHIGSSGFLDTRFRMTGLVPLACGNSNKEASEQGQSLGSHLNQGRQSLDDSSQSCPPVTVDTLWQRTYCDSWCIGLDFVTKEARPMKVWLDLVSAHQSGSIESRSRPVTISANTKHISGTTLQADHPTVGSQPVNHSTGPQLNASSSSGTSHQFPASESEHTITCVTTLPSFNTSSQCSIQILFCYQYLTPLTSDTPFLESILPKKVRTDVNEFCEGSKLKNTKSVINSAFVGQINISVKDIISDKYTLHLSTGESPGTKGENEIQRDLVSWQHIQQVTPLVIKATPSILLHLPTLLTDRCGLVKNQLLNCYACSHHALQHIQLQLKPATSESCQDLLVYTRYSNTNDLFRLVHHLYATLPEPIIILPREHMMSHDLASTCLPTMQQEVNFLSHALCRLVNEAEKTDFCELGEEAEVEDIRTVGDSFKRKRETFWSREHKCLDENGSHELHDKLEGLQLKTDLAIACTGCH